MGVRSWNGVTLRLATSHPLSAETTVVGLPLRREAAESHVAPAAATEPQIKGNQRLRSLIRPPCCPFPSPTPSNKRPSGNNFQLACFPIWSPGWFGVLGPNSSTGGASCPSGKWFSAVARRRQW